MYDEQENVFYYITCMNENYAHPSLPEDAREGIIKGIYKFRAGGKGKVRVNLLGAGTILREVLAAAEMLESEFGVPADVFSVTSFSELRREALDIERWNLLHPDAPPKTPFVRHCLERADGPFIAATDYMRTVPDQIRQWVPGPFYTLGTDGYGRSDSRAALRDFFEVDRRYIVLAALRSLADTDRMDMATVTSAIERFEIDREKVNPVYL